MAIRWVCDVLEDPCSSFTGSCARWAHITRHGLVNKARNSSGER